MTTRSHIQLIASYEKMMEDLLDLDLENNCGGCGSYDCDCGSCSFIKIMKNRPSKLKSTVKQTTASVANVAKRAMALAKKNQIGEGNE